MKIVLVFPPFYMESMYNLPPLGIVNLATSLKDTPHQVVLVDFVLAIRRQALRLGKNIYDDCADWVLDEQPDLVGFSAQCTTYPATLQIAKRIKESRPHVQTVIGGHNASFVDLSTLEKFPFIDAIVRGEGEITFKELVTTLESGHNLEGVRGVSCRIGERLIQNQERDLISDLNTLPLPDYKCLPSFSEYREACGLPRSIAILEVGRGCPYHCVYCSESIMWRRRTRTFSVTRLLSEIDHLHTHFGTECFSLSYDQFTANRAFVESFCRGMIERRLNHLPWYCISRLDSVDVNLLALMQQAGCESMCYGIDSGSERTLTFIRKNIDPRILYQRVVETADQGIIPTLSFVIGFPEEQKEDIDQTLWMALRTGIVGNNNPLLQMPTVLPGTDLSKKYANALVRRVDTYFSLGLEFDEGKRLESDEEFIDSDPIIFSSFYNIPCQGLTLEKLNLVTAYFPLMVRFYPKSFLLLTLEMGASVSDLFLDWLHWLERRLGRGALTLSPQDCYRYFNKFVSDTLINRGPLTRPHLPDILRYETTGLEAGKFPGDESPFHIDLHQIHCFRPARNDKMLLEEFAFDLPVIILDLKAGKFGETYPRRQTWLIFTQHHDMLDVTEINAFAKDLIHLCNGEKDLQAIAKALYAQYGEGMNEKAFFDSCVDAVRVLGNNHYLKTERSSHSQERR